MSRQFRFLLLPFSLLYGLAVYIRNALFEIGIIPSYKPRIPTITVGNLSTGGTGKTPFVEYLLKHLESEYKIAVVSRGYARNSRGFFWVKPDSSPVEVGDEPLQIKQYFPNVIVAVCEKRKNAIRQIEQIHPEINLILLDDAFQHRYVKPHLSILLTTFAKPYFEDFLLPVGNLRESPRASKRSDFVIVTKCPQTIEEAEYKKFKSRINKILYFSKSGYGNLVGLWNRGDEDPGPYHKAIALSGLASSDDFENELRERFEHVYPMPHPDHTTYSQKILRKIEAQYESLNEEGDTCVVTTAKDAVKLRESWDSEIPVFILPVVHHLENEERFFGQLKSLLP